MANESKPGTAARPVWMYVVAVLAVAAVAAAVWYATRTDDGAGSGASLASLDSSVTADSSDGAAEAPDRDAPERETDAPDTQPGPGTTRPPQQMTPPAGGGSGSASTPAERPTEPAPEGAELTTVTTPPQGTVAMIEVPAGFESAQFAITFRPYGPARTGPTGLSMVVSVLSMEPVSGQTDQVKDLTGRNAVAGCSTAVTDVVSEGGTYSGTLEVRAMGEVATLVITKVGDAPTRE